MADNLLVIIIISKRNYYGSLSLALIFLILKLTELAGLKKFSQLIKNKRSNNIEAFI